MSNDGQCHICHLGDATGECANSDCRKQFHQRCDGVRVSGILFCSRCANDPTRSPPKDASHPWRCSIVDELGVIVRGAKVTVGETLTASSESSVNGKCLEWQCESGTVMADKHFLPKVGIVFAELDGKSGSVELEAESSHQQLVLGATFGLRFSFGGGKDMLGPFCELSSERRHLEYCPIEKTNCIIYSGLMQGNYLLAARFVSERDDDEQEWRFTRRVSIEDRDVVCPPLKIDNSLTITIDCQAFWECTSILMFAGHLEFASVAEVLDKLVHPTELVGQSIGAKGLAVPRVGSKDWTLVLLSDEPGELVLLHQQQICPTRLRRNFKCLRRKLRDSL